jgi:glycosyltransferase involved in cell wall biosynthesis
MARGDWEKASAQVVIAALNEEAGIGLTIAELLEFLGAVRVVVVDGGSTDRTVEVAKKMGAEIFYQHGTGKGDALAKGLSCINFAVDYVALIDADYTYPAEYVPEMIRILDDNPEIGMVCGNRFTSRMDPQALDNVFYLGNRVIAFAHNLLNGIQLSDPLTGLRVVRSEILKNWNVKSTGFDVEVELNHVVERQGFAIAELPISYRPRLGEKKLKVRDGIDILKRIVMEALTESFHRDGL